MKVRCRIWLFRLSLILSTGIVLGSGCLGPDDLRRGTLQSFNSLVFRAIELWLADLLGIPTEPVNVIVV